MFKSFYYKPVLNAKPEKWTSTSIEKKQERQANQIVPIQAMPECLAIRLYPAP
jgi:hypothetical protein